MKRLLIILIFGMFSLQTPSACFRFFVMEAAPSYSDYDALLRAVAWVESRDYDLALNVKEQACGRLQIRACRIIEYNRRTGRNYELHEMFEYDKAKEVFLYYAQGKSYEVAARSWNGAGRMTIDYWKRVKKAL